MTQVIKGDNRLVWLFLQFVLASYISRTVREVNPVNQVDKKQGMQANKPAFFIDNGYDYDWIHEVEIHRV